MVQSYKGNTILVAFSLIGFISGYRICQFAVSPTKNFDIPVLSDDAQDLSSKTEFLYFLVGMLMISQGFVYLTTSIIGQEITTSIIGGGLIITGYIPTHLSVNETVI